MECGYREKNIKISVSKYVTGEAPFKILIVAMLETHKRTDNHACSYHRRFNFKKWFELLFFSSACMQWIHQNPFF